MNSANSRFSIILACVLSACLVACDSSSSHNSTSAAQPEATAAGAQAAKTSKESGAAAGSASTYEASMAMCLDLIKRERECTDQYIPMLVDLRVELDKPKGFAEQVATPEARTAAIAAAKQEWQADSSPDKARRGCAFIAASIPPAQAAKVKQDAEQCMARESCDEFVSCIKPMQASFITGR